MKKIFVYVALSMTLVLAWCGGSPTSQSVPELFSYLPQGRDQIIHIDVDKNILDILERQYGKDTPVVQEFSNIQELALWQQWDAQFWNSLLMLHGDDIDISNLAVLGLLWWDDSYWSTQISDSVYAYGQDEVLKRLQFQWIDDNRQVEQLMHTVTTDDRNLLFLSNPWEIQLPGIGWDFSDSLQGTVGSFSVWTKVPTWEARLMFGPWIVPRLSWSWAPTVSSWSPIHISINNIVEVINIDKTLIETTLPLLLQQRLPQWWVLLGVEEYSTIYEALRGTIWVDLSPSQMWLWGRLTLQQADVADLLIRISPVLDWYFKTWPFAQTELTLEQSQQWVTWTSQIPTWVWSEIRPVDLFGVNRTSDVSQIEFMNFTPLGRVESSETKYPAKTFLVWNIDFALLSQILWGSLDMFGPQQQSRVNIQVTAHHNDNYIWIRLDGE